MTIEPSPLKQTERESRHNHVKVATRANCGRQNYSYVFIREYHWHRDIARNTITGVWTESRSTLCMHACASVCLVHSSLSSNFNFFQQTSRALQASRFDKPLQKHHCCIYLPFQFKECQVCESPTSEGDWLKRDGLRWKTVAHQQPKCCPSSALHTSTPPSH